jgi:aminoglycoside 2'-N-acetyltransferase I
MSPVRPYRFEIQVVNYKNISATLRRDIISLCNRAYGENLEPLFETFVEPSHILGYCDGLLVSHALWVTRYLQAGMEPVMRTAYIEFVSTDPIYRRRGYARSVMHHLIGEIQDYDLAALSPFNVEYYSHLGWELWRGPLFIRQNGNLLTSPEDEEVMIYRLHKTPPLDLNASLLAEWREGELW